MISHSLEPSQILDSTSDLNSLRSRARRDPNAALREVATLFEAMLTRRLLAQTTTGANAQGTLGGGDGTPLSGQMGMYQDMFHAELGNHFAQSGSLGLGEMIVRQLGQQLSPSNDSSTVRSDTSPNSPSRPGAGFDEPSVPAGGIHAIKLQPGEGYLIHQETLVSAVPSRLSAREGEVGNGLATTTDGVDESPGVALRTFPHTFPSRPVAVGFQVPTELSVGSRDEPTRASQTTPRGQLGAHINPPASHSVSHRAGIAPTDGGQRFASPAEFVRAITEHAHAAAEQIGVTPAVLIAQAALETGWGRHIIRREDGSSHNLFGIKAHGGWTGPAATVRSLEVENGTVRQVRSPFRVYDSFAESFSDYVNFVKSNPRYQAALAKAENPHAYITELHRAGYATDPEYANKVITIMERLPG